MRIEVLDKKNNVLKTLQLKEGLTLLGKSPSAHVLLNAQEIAPLQLAIKFGGTAANKEPVIMDLGGSHPLKVNGKSVIEYTMNEDLALLEIGSQRIRLHNPKVPLPLLQQQAWAPVVERRKNTRATVSGPALRVRLYCKGTPLEASNTLNEFYLNERQGLVTAKKVAWIQGSGANKQCMLQLPSEWIKLGGRIQVGKDQIAKLEDFANPQPLNSNSVYRIYAGPYLLEILFGAGRLVIGNARLNLFPKELQKPFAISLSAVLALFTLWNILFMQKATKVEEPYTTYARIQNIPVEKILEPEPNNEPQAGGGSGSEAKENMAPQPSKLAASLTGGLKNLMGSVLSGAKTTSAVVSETGLGQATQVASNTQTKLAAVGQGSPNAVASASKIGNLSIAGSGKGFSGGSGMGLGTGIGNGIGSGVGNGIGKGSYKLVEEESFVDGGLDKSVIAAVIQNNLSQIKYCYERQLVAEPDLFGKVVALWYINAAGNVESPSVKQTTLNSSNVEQCMMAKIATWKFPQPKNGVKVTVNYPFLFKSTK